MLYSATLSDEALAVSNTLMTDPIRILMKKEKLTLEGIKQQYVVVSDNNAKVECIRDLYGTIKTSQVVIFVSHQRMAERVAKVLIDEGHDANYIHSGMDQKSREEIMSQFRNVQFRIMVCTDLMVDINCNIINISVVVLMFKMFHM